MKLISLTQGYFTKVDDHWYSQLSQMSWHFDQGYAKTRLGKRHFFMHHFIKPVCLEEGERIDHMNGDKLDNQESNLRICDSAQNQQNRKTPSNNTSGYKGVTYNPYVQRWHARIMVRGNRISLGMYRTAEGAAKAYNEAAKKYFGEFAKLNTIPNEC